MVVPMYPPKALVMETTGTGTFYANEKQRPFGYGSIV